VTTTTETPVLRVEHLDIDFWVDGTWYPAVIDATFDLAAGEVLAIVGESGSGKSMTARAIMGLIRRPGKASASRMTFDGIELLAQSAASWRNIRGSRIAMILQDPKFSLNPVQRVGRQIAEAGLLHGVFGHDQARRRVLDMLETVGVDDPSRVFDAYPHQLSGGIGQRAMIAAMMIASPSLMIADEPTSALDVMVRAQVLGVMDREIRKRGMGLLLISHDLAMVASFCDRVLVMYRGRVVDTCAAKDLFLSRHPYTQGLLNCLPTGEQRGHHLRTIDRAHIDAMAETHGHRAHDGQR
jgi:peptide/nickel transport system ATP-binding protein